MAHNVWVKKTAAKCDVTEKTLGIDVAVHQGKLLDWAGIYASGVRFTFNKSTEGQGYVDPTWERNASEAKRAGLLVGSYHFFWPNRDPDIQAEHYFKVAGSRCDLPPVIDFETTKGMLHGDCAASVYRFVVATEALWKRPCIVYSYPSFIEELVNAKSLTAVPRYKFYELAARDLWIAHYTKSAPKVPYPWQMWKFWQFDGDGGMRLPQGVDADFNWFAGSEQELRDYCKHDTLRPSPMEEDTQPGTPTSKSSQRLRAVNWRDEKPIEVPRAVDVVRALAEDK